MPINKCKSLIWSLIPLIHSLFTQNSLLPPSQRMKNQTSKAPTGPYHRKKLLDFLEKKAKEEKDWEQNKPFVKEIRGMSKSFSRRSCVGQWLWVKQTLCQTDDGEVRVLLLFPLNNTPIRNKRLTLRTKELNFDAFLRIFFKAQFLETLR